MTAASRSPRSPALPSVGPTVRCSIDLDRDRQGAAADEQRQVLGLVGGERAR